MSYKRVRKKVENIRFSQPDFVICTVMNVVLYYFMLLALTLRSVIVKMYISSSICIRALKNSLHLSKLADKSMLFSRTR